MQLLSYFIFFQQLPAKHSVPVLESDTIIRITKLTCQKM